MRPASIRARLTLWYFAVQAVTFAALGIGIFFAVRGTVHAAIDEDLRQRLQGIRRFMDRIGPTFSEEDLADELREHSGLRPGGDLLQVSDAQGNWIFRSASSRNYDIPKPGAPPGCNTKPMLFAGFLCGLFLPTLEYPEIPTRFSWRRLSLKYLKSSSNSNGCSFYPSRPCSFLQASADIG